MRFDRCKKLFSKFDKLKKLKILIVGVGGVGGYALDCLYKSGVCDITIVDFDKFDITNQNRQIGSEFVGEYKVEVLKKIYPGIKAINKKITPENIDELNLNEYDIIVDAIDDLKSKIALIKAREAKNIISSMGAAKRVDPTQIRVDKLKNTHTDPFARRLRQLLKEYKDLKVVFSTEKPIECDMGSFVAVTGAFGFTICSEILKDFV